MAKTVFTDGNPATGQLGTVVDAAFLNLIFAHRHDGLNQDGSAPINFAADTGAANAYVIELTPALTARIPGMPIYFQAASGNTGASTINDGLGTVAIVRANGTALSPGDIGSQSIIGIVWNGTAYQMFSQSARTTQGTFATDTGAANAYVIALTPALTARVEGLPIYFQAAHSNNGASTVNDGLGSVALVRSNGAALMPGDISAGYVAGITWNGSDYELISPSYSVANYFAVDTGVANAYVIALSPALTARVAGAPIYFQTANGNTGPSTINDGVGVVSLLHPDGGQLNGGEISGGSITGIAWNGSAYQIFSAMATSAEQTYYVRTDGSDANNGSANSPGEAFATINGALNYLNSTRSIRPGSEITIVLGTPGTYAAPSGNIPTWLGSIVITGNIANQSAYIISGNGTGVAGGVIGCGGGMQVYLQGLTIANTGTIANGLLVMQSGSVSLQNVTFTAAAGNAYAHIAALNGGAVWVGSGCIFGSGAGEALLASGNGNIFVTANIEILDNLAWSTACVVASYGGVVIFNSGVSIKDAGGVAPTGNTGYRYQALGNGVICTNGGGASFIPGNTAGSLTSGGQYL